ncbi:MAG: toxic anion resistance protein [Clostridium sp.]|nr:toxic anion resistance protein [Clostridium sp.]
MALQFNSTSSNNTRTQENTNKEIVEVESFDIVEKRQEIKDELLNSPEIEALTAEIDVGDPQTIVSFGGTVAEDISRCSDTVLNSMNMQQINDSGQLLVALSKVMDQFDPAEIANDGKQGLFSKLLGSAKKQLDKILAKYHTMGEEVDKIHVQLKQYEDEIIVSNKKLQSMFETNVAYYQTLVKYIVAGERGLQEIDDYLANLNDEFARTGNNEIQLDINNLQQARNLLDQRTQDLRVAENVAMQSIPMIKTMQYSNLNLIRKINSAFIITLPVFKQALTQAILLKRQKIQADALKALDDKTNEMLIKNAQNTVAQSKLTAQLASGSSIKIETLEQTWRTIVNGIDETRRIEEQARVKRKEDAARLETLKADFKKQMFN